MRTMIPWIISVAALIPITFIFWRFASRRHSLPCPSWLSWMVELDNPLARSNHAVFIVRQLNLCPGMSVLDAGCGPGRLTMPLAKEVGPSGAVVAVDIQDGMLAVVHEKARAAGLGNVTTHRAQIGQGTLDRQRFDRAVMAAVLGEVPDRGAAMTEMFHVLKPGGILAVAELIFDPHFQRRGVVRELAAAAGFVEKAHFGGELAYLQLFEKPCQA